MLLEVTGPGTLVPRETRWIAAQTDARVDRILLRPGAAVQPGSVLIEMSNPDLQQQAEAALYDLKAAEADLTDAQLQLRDQQLDRRASLAAARADYESAQLTAQAEQPLAAQGIVPALQYKRDALSAGELKVRMQTEEERLTQFSASMSAQLDAKRAHLDQARNIYRRRTQQVESLQVRAGIAGVLQDVLVEEGQHVQSGANLARVARPDDLRAELQIPETEAHEVQIGQRVAVDTRNGIVAGQVVRIDPAVQDGTVKVDVDFTGKLPAGARPDLSVDGTIEIERLTHVMYTGRPANAEPDTTVNLFKLVQGGRYAVRAPVRLGRTSTNAVEIVRGLAPGDQVILSDTSAWAADSRIRLTQ
jgi:HlyD family secretion protein